MLKSNVVVSSTRKLLLQLLNHQHETYCAGKKKTNFTNSNKRDTAYLGSSFQQRL